MSADKKFKLRIYVDRPEFMVSKDIKKQRAARAEAGEDDVTVATLSDTGHAFIGLVDDNGKEERLGFHAKSFWYGAENVPEEDRIESMMKDGFKKVSGFVKDETGRRFDDMLEYDLNKKQFDDLNNFIGEYKKDNKPYCLMLNNCVVFARKCAKAAGVRPPAVLTGIHSPHGMSISIRARNKMRSIQKDLSNASKKLGKFFSNTIKAAGKLLDPKRLNAKPAEDKKADITRLMAKKIGSMSH